MNTINKVKSCPKVDHCIRKPAIYAGFLTMAQEQTFIFNDLIMSENADIVLFS